MDIQLERKIQREEAQDRASFFLTKVLYGAIIGNVENIYEIIFVGGKMIEDNDIKTKVSPFAMREGEIKVFDGKDGYVSMNQILQKINIGQISEIHFQILELINEFEFLTSRQLFQLLEMRHVEIQNQDKLTKRLEALVKNKIITRYYFTSAEGKGIFRVYCLEKMGKYLLNSREIECKWQPSDNAKPVEMMKKKLAGNQLLIAYMRKVKAMSGYTLKPQIRAKVTGKIFKPIARINFSYNNQSVSFVYEVIRRNTNWERQLIDRMYQWREFYENFVPGDSEFMGIPQLVFVCEDEKHMAEVFRTLVINNIKLNKINYYYTTDLVQNEDGLEKSLYDFVESDGKYKIRNVSAKILG